MRPSCLPLTKQVFCLLVTLTETFAVTLTLIYGGCNAAGAAHAAGSNILWQ